MATSYVDMSDKSTKEIGTVTAGKTMQITISNSTRMLLVLIGSETEKGMWIVNSTTGGTVTTKAVATAGSVSISTDYKKVILSNSGAYNPLLYGILFAGEIESVAVST